MLGIGRLLQPEPPPFVLADISVDEVLDRLDGSRPRPADDMRRLMSLPAMPKALPSGVGAIPFEGGNQSHDSILEFVRYIADAADTENVAPTAGGTLTINGQALGSYDYTIKVGNQTISSFSNTDWFTTTADSRSAIIVVKGDLTINSGQALIPSHRKLFVTVYVTGNLVVNGGISMSARGANHSATGSNISANAIRIATGTFSSVSNPQVPAAGANGGAAVTGSGQSASAGNNGSTGTNGATGGGGSGGRRQTSTDGSLTSGAGAQGSGFGGGPGGGGARSNNSTTIAAEAGAANGGKGGDGAMNSGLVENGAAGGAGNPGGTGEASNNGTDGTGGILFVIVEGNYSGSGSITAAGANGGTGGSTHVVGGGGSGGGSVTMLIGGTDSGPTPTALGGLGGEGVGGSGAASGGNGGNGTARKLALA